jgi:glycosyltransferase involved in cell wall biosynthesis
LWKQGIQLVFVGGVGIKTPKFEEQYQALDEEVKGMIVFLHDLPVIDLKALYKNCLLFVYPSLAEGFGIPPLEALACGANVICSNTTAMTEFQFLSDRLFNPANLGEMKDKIDFFLKNPEKNKLTTHDYLKSHYSWDTAAKRLLKLIQ